MFDLKYIYKIVLLLVIVSVVLFISYKAYKKFEAKRNQNLLDTNVSTTTVNGAGVTINIGSKASEINDALHGSWYDEDETKAINAVLSTPKNLIPKLSQTYFALTGINLKTDLQSYLGSSEWLQIQSQFN